MTSMDLANKFAPVGGIVYARVLRLVPSICNGIIALHRSLHERYGTILETSRKAAKRGSTPKSPYKPHRAGRAPGLVRYSGYSVKVPFGSYRVDLVRLLCRLVDRDARSMLDAITTEVWQCLVAW